MSHLNVQAQPAKPSVNSRLVRSFQTCPGWVLDVGVGCFLVFAFLIFLAEPLPSDPMLYLEAGQDPLQAELNPGTARLGLLIPITIASLLFGFSEASLYALPLTFIFVFGAATSALGRQVLGRGVGIAAALVAASGPIILLYGTQLLPDLGAAALITACLAFVFKATKGAIPDNQRDALIAGLLFGGAYLVRETSLILVPAILVAAWILQLPAKAMIWLALGALVAPALEMPIGWIIWDDPLFRLDAVTSRSSPLLDQNASSRVSFEAQANFFTSFKIVIDLLWESAYGKVMLLGGGAFSVMAAVTRKRQYLALSAWILLAWAAFAAVGTIKPSGRLIIRLLLERYWAFLMPALAVATVGAFTITVRRVGIRRKFKPASKVLAVLAAVTLVLLGALASFDARGDWFMRFGNDGFWQLRSVFGSVPDGAQIHVQSGLTSLVRVYTNDPLGRPVSEVDIVPMSTASSEGADWLLMSDSGQGSSSVASERANMPLPDAYRVFAAETDHPSWVLLTADADQAVDSRSVLEVGDSGVEWLGRRVKDGAWDDAFELSDAPVEVSSGETLVIFESSAAYGRANSESLVAPDDLVEVAVQLHSIDGTIRVVCQFHDSSGPAARTDVRALSVLHEDDSGRQLTSFCRAPESNTAQIVRPVLIFDGPGSISIGSGRVLSHRT